MDLTSSICFQYIDTKEVDHMKNLIVLYGDNCAYCKKAKMLLHRALEKSPEYSSIEIEYIKDDSPEGKSLAHKYIPAFYIEGNKLFEGNPQMNDIKRMLSACLDV